VAMSVTFGVCTPNLLLLLLVGWLSTTAAQASELQEAVKADDAGRVQAALAAGADINENDVYLGSPLHIAVARRSVEIVKLLIDSGANVDAEGVGSQRKAHPLHVAARVEGLAVATLLLERGAKVDSRDQEGRTPLIIAASNGQTEVAELLLQKGADPLAEESAYHDTAIYIAAMHGHLGVVRLMLSKGVGVNVQNTHTGETPLWVAAMDNRTDVMEFLLSNGADPNIANHDGKTPIQVSVSSEAKDLLRKFGARD
jgi:ankyrin repeat protein